MKWAHVMAAICGVLLASDGVGCSGEAKSFSTRYSRNSSLGTPVESNDITTAKTPRPLLGLSYVSRYRSCSFLHIAFPRCFSLRFSGLESCACSRSREHTVEDTLMYTIMGRKYESWVILLLHLSFSSS